MILSSVDFPAPLRPMIPSRSPCAELEVDVLQGPELLPGGAAHPRAMLSQELQQAAPHELGHVRLGSRRRTPQRKALRETSNGNASRHLYD